jgi:NAD(P)-dependent dehydrogenase (short-subunit alcohol dehydrogenase family)
MRANSNRIIITGAAQGVGRSLAVALSKQGAVLGLVDKIDTEALALVGAQCEALGAVVMAERIDVRDQGKIRDFIDAFTSKYGGVDLTIANAGESPLPGTPFSVESARDLMETNYFSALNTILPALDIMKMDENKSDRHAIVVVTSIGAIVSTQSSGTYSASKMALFRFVDSLRLQNRNSNIQIINVVLGFVRTQAIEGLKHAQLLSISPETAAKRIIRAIDRNREQVSIPRFFNIPWWVTFLLPSRLREWILDFVWKQIYG